MKEILNDEHIELDYDDNRITQDLYEYRLSIFDKNMHYVDEIFLNKEHLLELFNGLKKINIEEDVL